MNELKNEKYLQWAKEIHLENDLILGDDSDSLLSCNLLTHLTNGLWNINYYYDFEDLYRIKETGLHSIGVDMAFTKKIRCFDNHLSKQYANSPHNPYCMNLNITKGINATDNYYKKYPFSTLMLVMAYYDIPLPESQLGKEIILAVDSSFIGHYATKPFFKKIHTDWLEYLGFGELTKILEQRDKPYFYNLQNQYRLNEKIMINEEGKLGTTIDLEGLQRLLDWELELPSKGFILGKSCIREGHKIGKKPLPERSDLISLAYTSKEYVSYTYQPKKESSN